MPPIDPANLGNWYDEQAARLVLYARQLLPPGEAEDVVQDVFIRLMLQHRPPDNVKAWLYRSVRNAAVSWLRVRRRRQKRERTRAVECREAFESRPDDLIDARVAEQMLASLPQEQREAVVLRLWAGMTLREIADLTGRTVTTAFRRYRAALVKMRQGMESSCRKKTV